jgi:hypothetical protein
MSGFRYPDVAGMQQLRLGDPNGGVNCTAYAGRGAGDADTRGALVFSGRAIRAATDEPRPDRASPGLNLRQVDEALFRLSKGVINLDTQWNAPWDRVTSFLRAGKWAELAIWRQVLVDHGHGGGNRFGKGHAILYGFDQDSALFVAIDPLVAHPQPVAESVMREAAAQMLTRAGVGAPAGAYVAFTRDVFDEAGNVRPTKYSVRFGTGSFFAYRVHPGTLKIQGRVARRFSHETSAPCDPPRIVAWTGKGTRRLARITKGVLAGLYVQPGAASVTLEESK